MSEFLPCHSLEPDALPQLPLGPMDHADPRGAPSSPIPALLRLARPKAVGTALFWGAATYFPVSLTLHGFINALRS